jgi:hypothetical protein
VSSLQQETAAVWRHIVVSYSFLPLVVQDVDLCIALSIITFEFRLATGQASCRYYRLFELKMSSLQLAAEWF